MSLSKHGNSVINITVVISKLFCLCILISTVPLSADTTNQTIPLAPGYGTLQYQPPEPGSYQLPPIGMAADAIVLNESAKAVSLHQMFDNKITLLSFIYSSCNDVNGCPLSNFVFYKIKSEMLKDPILAEKTKLISLSFDPENDTPEALRLFSANFKHSGNAGQWQFLTTESETQLQPILENYHQEIQRQLNVNSESGNEDISHILRVFLIDSQQIIRNIYSVAFLHPELLLNDIRTLLLEETDNQQALAIKTAAPKLSQAGDDKRGYSSSNYVTRSQALSSRQGGSADLHAIATNPPLGLPPINVPENNPLTKERIALGRKLFFDRRLSLNNTFSCAMCHIPEQGFTSNELSTAVGIEGRTVRRNSSTIYNVAYADLLFHDGREENLEQQIWGPLLARNEMGNPSVGYVLKKIRQIPGYLDEFKTAFSGKGPDMETTSQALASYQRTLISGDSQFDRWLYGKEKDALSPTAIDGYELFTGKAGCVSCHHINQDHALFTDQKLHNTGMGYQQSMGTEKKTQTVNLAPGVFVEVETDIINSVGETPPNDLGAYEISENPADRWKYKTPTLRNISLTAPYMHNGSFATLAEVIDFYDQGGIENEVLSPLIKPLNLNEKEKVSLLAFLDSLTGSNVDTLVADAFAAPVGDIIESNQ